MKRRSAAVATLVENFTNTDDEDDYYSNEQRMSFRTVLFS